VKLKGIIILAVVVLGTLFVVNRVSFLSNLVNPK
jgi:hypothetical protein